MKLSPFSRFGLLLAVLLGFGLLAGQHLLAAPTDYNICGDIAGNTVWTADGIYNLTCDVVVLDNVTLTINPGVTVSAGDGFALIVEGSLDAVGTSGQPILFTSASNNGPGDWAGLRFDGQDLQDGNGNLAYVTIQNGGAYHSYDGYQVSANLAVKHTAAFTMTNSTVQYSSGAGIFVEDASPWFTNLILDQNQRGLSCDANTDINFSNSQISNSASYPLQVEANHVAGLTNITMTNNTPNRILVRKTTTAGTVAEDATWSSTNQPAIYELDATLQVDDDVTLTLDPGVTILGQDGEGIMVYGRLHAVGTAGAPILFTSTDDDAAGQWAGLRFNGDGINDGFGNLSYVTIRNGGDDLDGSRVNLAIKHTDVFTLTHSQVISGSLSGVTAENSTVNFGDLSVSNNNGNGVVFTSGTQATIQNGVFNSNLSNGLVGRDADTDIQFNGGELSYNGADGLSVSSGAVTIAISDTAIISNAVHGIDYNGSGPVLVNYSQIRDNGGLGINNQNTALCLDATYNDWGATEGPNDASSTNDGCMGAVGNSSSGDAVSNDVYYYPWLKANQTEVEPRWTFAVTGEKIDTASPGGVAALSRLNAAPLDPGDTLRFTVTITNAFAAALHNVTFINSIPDFTTFVTDSDLPAANALAPLTWEGQIVLAGVQTYQFDVTIDADAGGQTITDTACIQLPGQPDSCTPATEPVGGGQVQGDYFIYLPLVLK